MYNWPILNIWIRYTVTTVCEECVDVETFFFQIQVTHETFQVTRSAKPWQLKRQVDGQVLWGFTTFATTKGDLKNRAAKQKSVQMFAFSGKSNPGLSIQSPKLYHWSNPSPPRMKQHNVSKEKQIIIYISRTLILKPDQLNWSERTNLS